MSSNLNVNELLHLSICACRIKTHIDLYYLWHGKLKSFLFHPRISFIDRHMIK